jgi:hypothetical protein
MNAPGDTPLAPLPSPASARWKAVLLLVAVFALGAGIGVGGTLYYFRSQVRHTMMHPLADRGRIDRLAARVEANLARSLDLDAGERQAVHEELAVSVEQARQLQKRMFFEINGVIRDTLTRIEKRLPPDKQAKLKRKAEHRLARWGFRADGPDAAQGKK